MSKVLDYIIKNIDERNKNEELEVIDELLEKCVISINDEVKKSMKVESLANFLVRLSIRDPLDEKLNSLLNKYKIKKELTSEQAYENLLGYLNKSKNLSSMNLYKSGDVFLEANPCSKDIVDFLISDEEKEKPLFHIIFTSINNLDNMIFLFDKIINQYLGFENMEGLLKNYIKDKSQTIIRHSSSSLNALLNVLNFKPEMKKYISQKGIALEKEIMELHPDKYIESIKDADERKILTDWYYARKFEKKNPIIIDNNDGSGNVKVLLSRADWFTTNCGEEDIISYLLRDFKKEHILSDELWKSYSPLKNFLETREKNFLVEYLSKNEDSRTAYKYSDFSKRLPCLESRKKNESGVLDEILDGSLHVFCKSENFFPLLKHLPSPMLLTSSPEKLLMWANSSPFYKMHVDHNDDKSKYAFLFDLTLSVIDKNFTNDSNDKELNIYIKEIKDKLLLQKELKQLNNSENNHLKNIKMIEDSGLSYKSLI